MGETMFIKLSLICLLSSFLLLIIISFLKKRTLKNNWKILFYKEAEQISNNIIVLLKTFDHVHCSDSIIFSNNQKMVSFNKPVLYLIEKEIVLEYIETVQFDEIGRLIRIRLFCKNKKFVTYFILNDEKKN